MPSCPQGFDRYTAFLERNDLEHIWSEGNGTGDFDERLAAAQFPPAVRPLIASDGREIASRLQWLRDGMVLDITRHAQAYEQPFPHPPWHGAGSRHARLHDAGRRPRSAQIDELYARARAPRAQLAPRGFDQAPRPHGPGLVQALMTEVTASVGTGFATTDMVLNIGPQHPATHGVLRLRLTLDGERVMACEPIIGYMHRGVEKLFEVRDYRQIIVLANRHDWLSAFSSELGVVLAVEDMLGMEVPERATWIRTLLAELNRVLNHLMFLGSYPLELGGITPIFYAFRERETIQEVMEEVSGGRMHYMFNRVGGLKEDIPAGWTGRASTAISTVRSRLQQIEDLVFGNEIFRARTIGVGVLSEELVEAYGVSGPIARSIRARLRPAARRALPRIRRAAGHAARTRPQ